MMSMTKQYFLCRIVVSTRRSFYKYLPKLMGNAESRKVILGFFNFIVGNSDDCEKYGLVRFIDRRSRLTELFRMRDYHSAINTNYKKSELMEFFCNLKTEERRQLLENIPEIIVAIPFDFKLFKIERTDSIGTRFGSFAGKRTEYPIYSILDLLMQLSVKNKDENS